MVLAEEAEVNLPGDPSLLTAIWMLQETLTPFKHAVFLDACLLLSLLTRVV